MKTKVRNFDGKVQYYCETQVASAALLTPVVDVKNTGKSKFALQSRSILLDGRFSKWGLCSKHDSFETALDTFKSCRREFIRQEFRVVLKGKVVIAPDGEMNL